MSYSKITGVEIAAMAAALPKNPERISLKEQTASDLAYVAAKSVLEAAKVTAEEIGCLLFSTVTPDYRSPVTAAVLQHRLNIPSDSIVYDVVLGGIGFSNLLQVGASVLTSSNKKFALLLMGNTPTKMVSALSELPVGFGDCGAAVLLAYTQNKDEIVVQLTTHDSGIESFIQREGAYRMFASTGSLEKNFYQGKDDIGHLEVNQERINDFLEKNLPVLVSDFLTSRAVAPQKFDIVSVPYFGENSYNKLVMRLEAHGLSAFVKRRNKQSFLGCSSIINLCHFADKSTAGVNALVIEFGEGFSVGIAQFKVNPATILPLIETDDYYSEGSVSHNF